MIIKISKGGPNPLELTWEERHPLNYCTGPTAEDMAWLKEDIKKMKKKIENEKKIQARREVKSMETLYSRIIELLQDFVRSREYLNRKQKQKLEIEIQFNSDLSDLRQIIQETEEEINQCAEQEPRASLSDVKAALIEVIEIIKGLETEQRKKESNISKKHEKYKHT